MGAEVEGQKTPRPETFWSNTEKRDNNPTLILARILSQRDFGLSISEQAVNLKSEQVKGYVAIHFTDPEAKLVMDELIKIPEIDILCAAYRGSLAALVFPTDVNWDEETKARVEICYLKQQEKRLMELKGSLARGAVIINQSRIIELLEKHNHLRPLTPDDIRLLLEPVVDRVLSQPR